MKQRSSEQDEFKTIFNELDEGVLIAQNNKISKFNNVFNQLMNYYFDAKVIKRVREISDAKESINLDKDIVKNQTRTRKLQKCLNYMLCWRENKKISDLTNNDRLQFLETEKAILGKKVFQRFLTNKEK